MQLGHPAAFPFRRYLLSLTGHRERAEDLAQETFLRAWRHLGRFEPRAPLRHWLYRIAHREFLRALERRREEASLEEVAEPAAPSAGAWTEKVELNAVLRTLPVEEREVLLLHHLEGYSSAEIGRIVRAPAGTVRYRLSQARARLQQELGEGDLTYLNEPSLPMRQWHWLPLEQMRALEARLSLGGRAGEEELMERRDFLRYAAASAAGVMLPDTEREIVDGRLTQKAGEARFDAEGVSTGGRAPGLALKGTALAGVCDHLRAETGVHLAAGASIADEKITFFCKAMPLREVMRQLAQPFGYTWSRSTRKGEHCYELFQDLRSQLLEEELRNRDRHAALLALDREIERYRPNLGLSPDEAFERMKTAQPAERALLERLATHGWGPIHMYFRLSRDELAALRAGENLFFSAGPRPGERPLPPDLEPGIIQSARYHRVHVRHDGGLLLRFGDQAAPEDLPLSAVPGVRGGVFLIGIRQGEPGEFTLGGGSGSRMTGDFPGGWSNWWDHGPLAAGQSSAVTPLQNAAANAKMATDPALQPRMTLACGEEAAPKVTTADVLEAFHQATGLPIVSDYYTRLYPAESLSVRDVTRFEALNRLAGGMRMRWRKEGAWLQFRSATYYHDRLKEVPDRLLSRWVAARQKQGVLTLEDLVEIIGLSDAQLDGAEMAEGARERFGLHEWDLARNGNLRTSLPRGPAPAAVRFAAKTRLPRLAGFTPEQRRQTISLSPGGEPAGAQGTSGLPFASMSLAQQQRFIGLCLLPEGAPLRSLDELAGATLRVEYTQPGGFQWGEPSRNEPLRWVVPLEDGPTGRRALRPFVYARTREAVLEGVRQVDPQTRAALLKIRRWADPTLEAAPRVVEEAEIFPTRLDLIVAYIPGTANNRPIHYLRPEGTGYAD